jgi:hypothetical protein
MSVPSFVAKRALIPRKEDLVFGLILAFAISIIFRPDAIYLLPLAIASVVFVFVMRRIWKMLTLYLFYRSMRNKADRGLGKVKEVFNLK